MEGLDILFGLHLYANDISARRAALVIFAPMASRCDPVTNSQASDEEYKVIPLHKNLLNLITDYSSLWTSYNRL